MNSNDVNEDDPAKRPKDKISCRVCGELSERDTMIESQRFGYVGGSNCKISCYEVAKTNRANADRVSRRYHF